MNQDRLRHYESQCIQEEPPFCQAACPLHVDARSLCRSLGEEKVDEAYKTLLRTLPLPRLLTRLCEEPCKEACKRTGLGGSVEMRALERFCVERAAPPRAPLPPRRSGKRVAVLGSGLSSLTAAWDLCRKGHSVELHHDGQPGGALPRGLGEDLEADLAELRKLGAAFVPSLPEDLSGAEFDAVYVGLDDPCCASFALLLGTPAPVSFAVGRPGFFAGGTAAAFIDRASEGRRAAQSVLRFLQGASLLAGREREGSFETRLYVNLGGIPSVPVASPFVVEAEARRCLNCQCLECVKVCRYLQSYGGYPKRYVREIYNNLSVVQGTRSANRMINSCSQCGLCAAVCPTGFDMGTLCAEARREMTRQGKMPLSAHEYALLDMEHADGPAALLRPDPDRPESCRYFFPGCQMTASDPDLASSLYGLLRKNAPEGLGLWLGCCGAPALWAGDEALFSGKMKEMERSWSDAGEPELIVACPSCLKLLERTAVRAVSIWDVLAEWDEPLPWHADAAEFLLYAPCSMRGDARRRVLFADLAAESGVRFHPSTGLEECCGYGGLQECAHPALADEAAARAAARAGEDFLVGCSMCRDRFASVGKRSVHLLSLLFPGGRVRDGVPPRPSERRENRERLKDALLSDLWGEKTEEKDMEGAGFVLRFAPGVREKLDKRRILDEDLRRVIERAEETGRKTLSPEGRSLACLRPRNVTTWVDYRMDEGAAVVYGAWTHRMIVVGAGASS